MKERMQKTISQVNGCPQRNRSETEWYGGVQTFMWMCEDNIVEVPFDKEHLFGQILSPANLNRAYKAVMRNKGCGGIDKMSCEQLLPWLLTNKDELIRSLMDGSYRPNPVKRVEIPKDNGKMRLLGIPTVVDRLVQQAINQVLTPIYENQFSKTSYGFRPRRGCHDALRGAQRIECSISQSQQGEDRSVLCARSEIPRLLLLCDERQMPTHGASKVQSQDEITTKRTDKSQ